MSSPCMLRFNQQFNKLKLEVLQRDDSTSKWSKARWVVQDKQKFEDLIKELAHFTSKLKELVPPIANFRTRDAESTNTHDLEAIHDLRSLKIILEASTGHRGAIAGSTQGLIDQKCGQRILQTLWFRKMTDRREDVTAAHEKTFAWIFQPPEEDHTWDDLSEWFSTGAGIYWISGKAGSGKSTLMKYLYSSNTTKSLLSEWAGRKKCTIADFFFWYLGTPEQNTQKGLSRALLYQILSRHPQLIARVLPTMWKEANEVKEECTPPSAAETKYAFEVLSASRELSPFCFFIDGVDEYVGNYKDGLALINRLAINPLIKIIASSRPIPQCVAKFEDLPMLELQELTRGDISSYVMDIIGNNAHMKRLLRKDPQRSGRILQDIVQKSSGVFLWVVLACRSLLVGFEDYDRIAELERRVQALPPELEEMFQHMLRKVDKRHEEQASRLLRLCYSKQKAQEQGATDIDGMYALDVASSAAYYDLEPIPMQFISDVERSELCKELDGRLRSRCGGLLELVKRKPRHSDMSFCFCKAATWDADNALSDQLLSDRLSSDTTTIHGIARDVFADAKVCFMHRKVFEFLCNDKIWELDSLKTNDAQFPIRHPDTHVIGWPLPCGAK